MGGSPREKAGTNMTSNDDKKPEDLIKDPHDKALKGSASGDQGSEDDLESQEVGDGEFPDEAHEDDKAPRAGGETEPAG